MILSLSGVVSTDPTRGAHVPTLLHSLSLPQRLTAGWSPTLRLVLLSPEPPPKSLVLWSWSVLTCLLCEPFEWLGLGIAFPSWLWEQCPRPGIFPNQIPLDLNTLLIHRLAHRDPARSMTLDFILSVVGTEGEKRRSQISLFPCILMGSELYPFPTRADLSQTSMCP